MPNDNHCNTSEKITRIFIAECSTDESGVINVADMIKVDLTKPSNHQIEFIVKAPKENIMKKLFKS